MELYYKGLISKEASLEKLVDNLMLVVQGAEEFAEAAGAGLARKPKEEITTRLQRLKEGCNRAKTQAVASALAVNKVIVQYPYSSAGFGFAAGLFAGVMLRRRL